MKKKNPSSSTEKFFNTYLACKPRSGQLRLLSWLAVVWFFMIGTNILFSSDKIINLALEIQNSLPVLSILPLGFLAVPLTMVWPFSGISFVLIPLGSYWLAILFVSRYVRYIYKFPSFSDAIHFTFSSLFCSFLPTMVVKDANVNLVESDSSWLTNGKGPGYIVIHPGSAILLEKINSPSRVISTGLNYITRFEQIKQIVDLRDQQLSIDEEITITKDRIAVKVKKAHFRYRIGSNARDEETSKHKASVHFPYSVEAIRNLVYNRSVTEDGITEWETAVKFSAFGAVLDYINENNFDRIFMPTSEHGDPRKEINLKVNSPEVRDRLKHIGTKLIWFDIGYIGLSEEYGDIQPIMPWQANWMGKITITKASGEAKRLAYQELGRAEAQAEMLKSFVNMLNDIKVSENSAENIRNVVLARTAQLLESMSSRTE
jgi:hypothetical protein